MSLNKTQILTLLAEGKSAEALEVLHNHTKDQPSGWVQTVVLLQASWKNLEKEILTGLLNHEEAARRRNRLHAGIVKLTDFLVSGEADPEKALRELRMDLFGDQVSTEVEKQEQNITEISGSNIAIEGSSDVVIGSGNTVTRRIYNALGRKQFWAIALGIVLLLVGGFYVSRLLSSGQKQVYASVGQVEGELDRIMKENLDLKSAVEGNKQEILNAFSEGIQLLKDSNYTQAIQKWESVTSQVPLPSVFESIGYAYEQMGDRAQAEASYQKAREARNALVKRKEENKRKRSDRGEAEPNNDLFTPTSIALEKWIQADIGEAGDKDHFEITTPKRSRDIIKIELKNQSTVLKPRIGIYDKDKQWLGGTNDSQFSVSAGRDIEYTFSAGAATNYFVYVDGLGNTLGSYQLKVSPLRAYDNYEPNESIFEAKPISLGKTIDANIMDGADKDYYSITSSKEGSLVVSLQNQSTTLKPRVGVYDKNKKWLGGSNDSQFSVTSGQNVEHTFSVEAGTNYFIYVDGLGRSQGDYRLAVRNQE